MGISRLTKNINFIYESFDFYNDIKYKNHTHIDGLVNGVDIIGQIHNIPYINDIFFAINNREKNLLFVSSLLYILYLKTLLNFVSLRQLFAKYMHSFMVTASVGVWQCVVRV